MKEEEKKREREKVTRGDEFLKNSSLRRRGVEPLPLATSTLDYLNVEGKHDNRFTTGVNNSIPLEHILRHHTRVAGPNLTPRNCSQGRQTTYRGTLRILSDPLPPSRLNARTTGTHFPYPLLPCIASEYFPPSVHLTTGWRKPVPALRMWLSRRSETA